MNWTELVTLMDREASRLDEENDHCAAILMRLAAAKIREMADRTNRFAVAPSGVGLPFSQQVGQ